MFWCGGLGRTTNYNNHIVLVGVIGVGVAVVVVVVVEGIAAPRHVQQKTVEVAARCGPSLEPFCRHFSVVHGFARLSQNVFCLLNFSRRFSVVHGLAWVGFELVAAPSHVQQKPVAEELLDMAPSSSSSFDSFPLYMASRA